MRFSLSVAFVAGLAAQAYALTPITVKGNAFFAGNDRFYIRGVDYQPGGPSKLQDPLSNVDICSRDIPYMKELGLNTIRVYTIDNSKDHSECMKLLDEAGIYLILDVNTPTLSINRDYPEGSYNNIYLQHVFATIDVFADYDNVLGFFAANEVINKKEETESAAYVKAVIRDMKRYIKERGYRQIPVGYSAADVAENRLQQADYFNCGPDDVRADFFGFNDYSWCGGTKSSFKISGYDQKVKDFSHYSIPLFFSEYGCNIERPRQFTEVGSIYSKDMTPVFSGGLVYEWTEEENNYGIVEISEDGKEVKTGEEYENLKQMFEDTPNATGDGGYKKDGKPSECPPEGEYWKVSKTIPEFPSSASQYFENGAGKPLGTGRTNMRKPGETDAPDSDDSGDSDASPNDDDKENNAPGLRSPFSGGNMYMLAAVLGGVMGGAMMML